MSSQDSPHKTHIPAPSEDHDKCPRTLVLCFDGTGNEFEQDKNSNVVLLFQMLKRDNPEHQLVYYQTGIGTYAPTGFISTIGARVAQVLDEAVAWYLKDHVLAGYKFLMETYRDGDKICLFGFSRGAYTARALAAMLYRVGLLPPCNHELVPFAYKIFKESKQENHLMKKHPEDPRGYLSKNFRSTFSQEITIEFVGIWDTVSSVGLIPRRLPNTNKNPIVKHVRHALSLDERRAKFKAAYWSAPKEAKNSINIDLKKDQVGIAEKDRTVEEVWFAGGHGDVGGGWEGYKIPAQLSRIPLRWIVREATKCTDILWEEKFLKQFKVRKPKTDQEMAEYVEQEKADALAKYHSAFSHSLLWWLLEFLPLVASFSLLGLRFKYLFPNLFRARKVRKPSEKYLTKVHSSVKTRLKLYRSSWGFGYWNAAQWDPDMTEFVDDWALPADVS
ncbi:hypothetical protein FRB90_011229 [Tulasnella sp. 427]|nr:hypothetical protein FRB90_011229 [Tulasnella sp. 427]